MANILVLTPQLPYPPHQGTSLRNYHIIRGLGQRHAITLLSFREENQTADPETIAPLLSLCTAVHTEPVPARGYGRRLKQLLTTRRPDMVHRLNSPAFAGTLRRLLREQLFEVVQVEGLELAHTIGLIHAVSPGSKILFDDHNAETELQWRNMITDFRHPRRWPAAVYSWVQVGRLRRFERWACENADAVTAVSEADRRHLESLTAGPITVIPNCIDVAQYRAASSPVVYDLVFSGKMDYRPNVDAVLWFADEVWPQVRAARPAATWAIVGQRPHPRLARLRHIEGITVTGWVESIRPFLAGARLFIMPLRIGSGTRLKLIEAMAAGRAIVSTPTGTEGFPVRHGKELLLAKTAAEMGAAVLHLLDHSEERERLGEAAVRFAQQYDWRQVIPRFQELIAELLAGKAGGPSLR